MRFAIDLPNFAEFADPETILRLATDAEAYGWDGFFVWDHINPFREAPVPVSDPWILLAAVAHATTRIKIGPMVTPLPRRRPWKVARETATLDRLSGGRLIFGVGLGLPPDAEFEAFGEDADLKVRAAKLDEGLAIVSGLWRAEPFEFAGCHYRVDRTRFMPPPLQQPRIPVWVAGSFPKKGPLARAARWDGFFPMKILDTGEPASMLPDDVRQLCEQIEALRPADAGPFDMVVGEEVTETAPRDRAHVRALAEAGATWWCESLSTRQLPLEAMFERVKQGPPSP